MADPYADIVSDLESREASERRAREQMVRVASSWIDAYSYDEVNQTLYVRFKEKKTGRPTVTCAYHDVPPDYWHGFIRAGSKGDYFHGIGLYHWPYEVV